MKKLSMRGILQGLLLVALMCMPWVTRSQSFNFSCDFENVSDTAAWDYVASATTNQWCIGTAMSNGGNSGLYISPDGGESYYHLDEEAYLYAYRTLTLTAGNYEYSYDWTAGGMEDEEFLRVALVPSTATFPAASPSDITATSLPTGWIAMDGGSQLVDGYFWETKSGSVTVPSAGSYKLVFYWPNAEMSYGLDPAAIDNVSLSLSTCASPVNLVVKNIKSDEATATWHSVTGVTAWEARCALQDGTGSPMVQTVMDDSVTFTGLSAQTDYRISVRSICGATDSSRVVYEDFRTACSMDLPYQDGFENDEEYVSPSCWTVHTGSARVMKISNRYPESNEGRQYVEVTGGGMMISPYIEEPLNGLELSFSLHYSSYAAGQMKVCVATDLNHLDNPMIVEDIIPVDGLIHIHEIDLSTTGVTTGGYIIFQQHGQDDSYNSFSIDDINITRLASCRRPALIEASRVTHEGARLTWSGVEGAYAYEVVYGMVNDPSSSENITVSDLNDTTLDITGLEANRVYYMWVRNQCASENSDWRAGLSFTTQVACAEVTKLEAADVSATGIALSWSYNRGVGATATEAELSWKASGETTYNKVITDHNYYILQGLQPNTEYTFVLRTICGSDTSSMKVAQFSTTMSGVVIEDESTKDSDNLPLSTYYKYTYSQMVYKASELVGVDTIRSIAFRPTGNIQTSRTVDVYMGNIKRSNLHSNNYVGLDSLTKVGTDITFNLHAGWCAIDLDSPFVHRGDSNLVIAMSDKTGSFIFNSVRFDCHNGSSVVYTTENGEVGPNNVGNLVASTAVPDILIAIPYEEGGCVAPMAVMGEVTSSTAEVVWNRGLDGATYQVEYKLTSDNDWTVYNNAVADTMLMIDGLQAGEHYQFRVGNHCGEEILYSKELAGYTACGAIDVPYSEDFSGPNLNPCWVLGNTEGELVPERDYEGMLSMNYYEGGYVILPEFMDALSSMHMFFKIKATKVGAKLVVAIGDNNTDISTFEHIDTFAVATSGEFTNCECSFINYNGDGRFIALYSLDKHLYVDDILVEEIPMCSYPTNVEAYPVTSTTATISWEGNTGTSTEWMLVYHVAGESVNDTAYAGGDANSYTLTDLLTNTSYEVMVTNICGEDTVAALNSISFRTECAPISLPYMESFENEVVNTYHACWYSTNRHTYGVYDHYTPNVENRGSEHGKVMKFSDNVNMITCRIPSALNALTVSFDAMVENATYTGKLAVGYTTDPNDLTNAVYVDTIVFSNANWNHYVVPFTALDVMDEGYIVFNNFDNVYYEDWYMDYPVTMYYDGYIDNLIVMEDYGCAEVSDIEISEITDSSAKVSFADASHADNYTIGYSTVNDVNNITTMVSCIDTFATITNLLPNTEYYVWVRINCGSGSGLWVAAPMFRTNCSAISDLPYKENFDSYRDDLAYMPGQAPSGYPNHTLPNCWSFVNMSTVISETPQAYILHNSSSQPYADSANCLFMTSNLTTPIYAVLPKMDAQIDALQISFTYCQEGVSETNGKLALGVMTAAEDANTFTMVCEYPQVSDLTTITHNFSLDQLDEDSEYFIAFRYTAGTGNKFFIGLDNIEVGYAPTCPMPEGLNMTDATDVTASFAWGNVATAYNLAYKMSTAEDWTTINNITTNTYTITGLTAQTDYQIKIQSVCGEMSSEWTEVMNFSTNCGALSLPYVENFDSYTEDISSSEMTPGSYPEHMLPNCWSFPVLDNPTPRALLSTKEGYTTTGNCLMMVSSSARLIYAVLPKMDARIDTLQIYFNYRNESTTAQNSNLQLGVMTNPTDINTFTVLETYPLMREMTSAEHNFAFDQMLDENASYYIAFRYGGAGSGYCLSIEDVMVDYQPSCARPKLDPITNISASGAVATWHSDAGNFEVQYQKDGFEEWTSLSATDTTINLTNLSGSTHYNVRVRAICAANDTSMWSGIQHFSTQCGVVTLPFGEGFEDYANVDELECWSEYRGIMDSVINGSESLQSDGYWYLGTYHPVNDGGKSIYINIWGTNTNSWLATPSIYLSGVTNFEFDMIRDGYSEYNDMDDKFAVLATTDEGETWQVLRSWIGADFDNIPKDAAALHVSIDLTQFAGDTVRIAFYGESTIQGADQYISVDNVLIQAPTAPLCEIPTALNVENITETGAELSWQGTATSYELDYRVQGTEAWNSATTVATNYSLTDLQPATSYDWRVRAICDAQTTDWATSTFVTLTPAPICDIPTELTAEATHNTVTLDWSAVEGQSSWEVSITAEGMDEILTTVDSHPTTIDVVAGVTGYSAKVRAICGEDFYSDWSEPVAFNLLQCEGVSNVAVSNITTHSAKITWSAVEGQDKWEIMYGEKDFDQTQGTSLVASATVFTLSNLAEDSYYDVYVRAICGDGFYSEWSQKKSFQTLKDTEGINGVEGDFRFTIYPNPASNVATISLNGVEGKVVINVVDMNGRMVANESIECGSDCEKRIDVDGLAQGTYFVRVLGDNINSVRKLIVR